MSDVNVYKRATKKALLDPDWFCRSILKSPNDIWQSEIINSIADLNRIKLGVPTLFNHDNKTRFTICAFHGPGKTHLIAKLSHWWNFTRIGKIICTAPKIKQLKTRLWPEFSMLRNGANEEYKQLMEISKTFVQWGPDALNVDPNWVMIAETASNPDNMSGYHHKQLLFLVDESAGVNDEMFAAVEGTLTTEGAVIVLIGNPTKTEGEFYRSHNHRETKKLYYIKKIKHEESSRIDKKWVDGMIAKYGEDSPVVKVRVFGEFVESSPNQLIALSWIEDARNKTLDDDGSLFSIRVSIDVSDGGEDYTEITVKRCYDSFSYFIKQYTFSWEPGIAIVKAYEAATRIFKEYHETSRDPDSDDIVVDSLGVGAGVAGLLLDNDYPVILYKGGEKSDDPDQWRCRRVQSYIAMRNELRDGHTIIADDFVDNDKEWDEYTAQMCSVRSKPGVERVEDLETREHMRSRGIKSPDKADSPAMSYSTQYPSIGHLTKIESITTVPMESANHEPW